MGTSEQKQMLDRTFLYHAVARLAQPDQARFEGLRGGRSCVVLAVLFDGNKGDVK